MEKASIADITPELLADLSDEQVSAVHNRLHQLWNAVPRIRTDTHQGQAMMLYASRHEIVVAVMQTRSMAHENQDRLDDTLPGASKEPAEKREVTPLLWGPSQTYRIHDGCGPYYDASLVAQFKAQGVDVIPVWDWKPGVDSPRIVGCEVLSLCPWSPFKASPVPKTAVRKGGYGATPGYSMTVAIGSMGQDDAKGYYSYIHRYLHQVWADFGSDEEVKRLHGLVEQELRALGIDEKSPLKDEEDVPTSKRKMVEDPLLFRPDVPIRYPGRSYAFTFHYGQEEQARAMARAFLERDGVVSVVPYYSYSTHEECYQAHRVGQEVKLFERWGSSVPAEKAAHLSEIVSVLRSLPGSDFVLCCSVLDARRVLVTDLLWDAQGSLLQTGYGARRQRLERMFAGLPLPMLTPSGYALELVERQTVVAGEGLAEQASVAVLAAAQVLGMRPGAKGACVYPDLAWYDPRIEDQSFEYVFDPAVQVSVLARAEVPVAPIPDEGSSGGCRPVSVSPARRLARIGIDSSGGERVPLYFDRQATIEDLELRWDGKEQQWYGMSDPTIWTRSEVKVELGSFLPAFVDVYPWCQGDSNTLSVLLYSPRWLPDPMTGEVRLVCREVYVADKAPDFVNLEQMAEVFAVQEAAVLGVAELTQGAVESDDAILAFRQEQKTLALHLGGGAAFTPLPRPFTASKAGTFSTGLDFEGGREVFIAWEGVEAPERYLLRRTSPTPKQEAEVVKISQSEQQTWWENQESHFLLKSAMAHRDSAAWAFLRADGIPSVLIEGADVPPQGKSGLPLDYEKAVPSRLRWWLHPSEHLRKSNRDRYCRKHQDAIRNANTGKS